MVVSLHASLTEDALACAALCCVCVPQVVPGYGTDAFLTIRRLEEGEWREQMDEHAATMQVDSSP